MTSTVHRLAFRVSRERALDSGIDVWYAGPVDAPIRTGVTGRTLEELFREVEAVKHFILGVPEDTPVEVEYVYDVPGVPTEALRSYRQERAHLYEALRKAGVSDADSATLLDMPMTGAGLRRTG